MASFLDLLGSGQQLPANSPPPTNMGGGISSGLGLGSLISRMTQNTAEDRQRRLKTMRELAVQAQQQALSGSPAGAVTGPSAAPVTRANAGAFTGGKAGPGKIVTNKFGDKVSLSSIRIGNQSTQVNSKYAPQFQGLLNDLQAAGYNINQAYGFQDRVVAGTKTPSKHAGGYAIDINPSKNPYSTSGKTQFDRNVVNAILKKYPDIEWGGNWRGPRLDMMHFSVKEKIPGYSTL